ncbi:hypothetical protein GCM10026988_04270 [Vibrio panuliri]|uniref:Uncharacterized protein n=1 Tax=Vibrio panuliri TaxID=1381081 RepID=A0ABX3FK74_9VIBR|nr:hypothetical protein BIY20_09660 [Vibrio panuliri]
MNLLKLGAKGLGFLCVSVFFGALFGGALGVVTIHELKITTFFTLPTLATCIYLVGNEPVL